MQIKEIFAKDLFRPINGVVKAEQLDEAVIWQELDEYVVTGELGKHFRRLFDSYLAAMDAPNDPMVSGRIGVWVSGFFGSGKSHFIKILSYLIGNKEVRDPLHGQIKRAIQFFESKIKDSLLFADIKRAVRRDTDVILFNIDSKADASDGRAAVLSVFWRVFNEMQGFCGHHPHIAELERHLTNKGRFDIFCSAFEAASGSKWLEERDAYRFMKDEMVEAMSKALDMSKEAADEWFEKSEDEFSLTVEGLAKRVKEYLDRKGPDSRLIFLVDEVGQFIGSDVHLMLNLQTIVEDLGRFGDGRAWVVVTSQEDIDSILGEIKSSEANDFSKIQGRFTTRISLSGSNTDEVIQVRLLEKSHPASDELKELFAKKGDILRNQLSFSHDSATLKNYNSADDFSANYPFAPYHFQLVQKIFESIRKAGATGLHLSRGERSMLDAFQLAAKNVSEKGIGALVPLYEFYPAIESFIDTAVKLSIDQAGDNAGLDKPFDIHLLRTLFLIRYVDIIKPNIDNLVTLCIDQVDADRITLKQKITASLQRLERENLVSRSGDLYYFLTNEEREVNREIKGLDLASGEEAALLRDIIFDDLIKGKSKHRYAPNRRHYAFNRFCDGHIAGSKLEQDLAVEVLTPLSDLYQSFNESKCIMHATERYGHALIKLPDSPDTPDRPSLAKEVRTFLQTEKYIRNKSDAAASPTLKRILRSLADENRDRRNRLINTLDELLGKASCYALGHTLQVKGTTSKAAVDESLDYLVQNIYNKFHYLKNFHDNPQKELKNILLSDDVTLQQLKTGVTASPSKAMQEIKMFIDLKAVSSHTIILDELIQHFAKRPYGWPEWEIVIHVAYLFMAGEIHLVLDGARMEPKAAIEPLNKTSQWKSTKIVKRRLPPEQDLKKAQRLGQELFGTLGPEGTDALCQFLKKHLSDWRKDLSSFKPLADTGNYPGKKEIEEGIATSNKLVAIHDTFEFIKAFNDHEADLQDLSDDMHDLKDFYKNQKKTWEVLRDAANEFKPNQAILEKQEDIGRALRRMREILEAQSPYKMLKEVNGLISKVRSVNDKIIAEQREDAVKEVDQKIEQVTKLLDAKSTTSDVRNKSLYPLQNVKKKIYSETSIPHISFMLQESQEKYEEAIDLIEEATKPEPPVSGDDKIKAIKVVKIVKPAHVAFKAYLETEEDVDDYLQKLREALMAAIKSEARVRIQ